MFLKVFYYLVHTVFGCSSFILQSQIVDAESESLSQVMQFYRSNITSKLSIIRNTEHLFRN